MWLLGHLIFFCKTNFLKIFILIGSKGLRCFLQYLSHRSAIFRMNLKKVCLIKIDFKWEYFETTEICLLVKDVYRITLCSLTSTELLCEIWAKRFFFFWYFVRDVINLRILFLVGVPSLCLKSNRIRYKMKKDKCAKKLLDTTTFSITVNALGIGILERASFFNDW